VFPRLVLSLHSIYAKSNNNDDTQRWTNLSIMQIQSPTPLGTTRAIHHLTLTFLTNLDTQTHGYLLGLDFSTIGIT
jgi:hypothetical protein